MAVTLLRSLPQPANAIPLDYLTRLLVRSVNPVTLLFLLISLFVLKPLWCDGEVLAFRDTCHFYYPMWKYLDSLPMSQQLFPMWNPNDALGCSIIGEPTSMVFYPLRVILLLPFSALENRIGWFFVVHLWIAYFGWQFVGNRLLNPGLMKPEVNRVDVARPYQSSLAVAVTGAIYALSGPVFFQIYNPPFLIGACWLPLVMGELLHQLEWCDNPRSSRMPSGLFIFSISMLFLCGDIQSVYHVFLLASLMLVVQAIREHGRFSTALRHNAVKMSLAVVVVVGITTIQWLPTYYWYSISERSAPSRRSAEYAVAWWEFVSVFQPNIFGSLIPNHTRWAQVFDPQKRVWVPSLHLSLFVVCGATLAIASKILASNRAPRELNLNLQPKANNRPLVFLFTVVTLLVAFFSSLESSLLDQLWRSILPIYDSFRYSAKWITFIAWAVCFLAMIGWHEWNPTDSSLAIMRYIFASCLTLAVICLTFHCVATNSQFLSDSLRIALYPILDDPLCGPFDYSNSLMLFGWSSLINMLVAIASVVTLRWARSGHLMTILGAIALAQVSLVAYDQVVAVNAKVFVSSASDMDANRIVQQNWVWGDRSQTVLLPRADTSAEKNELLAVDLTQMTSSELLVHRQVALRVGKLHLLFGERSYLSDFTLRPQGVNVAIQTDSKGYWQASNATIDVDPNRASFKKVTIEPTVVEFHYEYNDNGDLLLPILQDGGWFCESEEGEIMPDSFGSRIRLAVNRGNDQVVLRYFTPGLYVGFAISIATILAFYTRLFWRRVRKP